MNEPRCHVREIEVELTKELPESLRPATTIRGYRLESTSGVVVELLNYGATLCTLECPDRHGNGANVLLGYPRFEDYIHAENSPYFGAVVGRYANRIAKGQFLLDGKKVELSCNNGQNHLHGGEYGFDKVVWQAEIDQVGSGEVAVEFSYYSEDGEEGYPGNLDCRVRYSLNEDSELSITYTAQTDKPTVINLTNHAYYNLACGGDVLGHELVIHSDRYLPINEAMIPTGELLRVDEGVFDFRQPKRVGESIEGDDEQLKRAAGFDHCYVLTGEGATAVKAAELSDPLSGRYLELWTDQPGVHLYTGNFLSHSPVGEGAYSDWAGLCLETQHFPDSPNHSHFPTTVLRPGEVYLQRTIIKCGVIAAQTNA